MTNIQKIFFLLFVLFLAVIPAWFLLVVPSATIRISNNWEWVTKFEGSASWADANDEWGETLISVSEKEITIVNDFGEYVVLRDRYSTKDPISGEITWEYIPKFAVNKETAKNVTHSGVPDRTGYYYMFPRNVEKTTYEIWGLNYLKKISLTFIKEETIEGLDTYLFEFRGDMESSETYAESEEYPGVELTGNQEVRSPGDGLTIKYWVEPVTGEIVKIDERSAGDYIVDKNTGEKIAKLSKWTGKTTGDTVLNLVKATQNKKQMILLYERWIPILFGLIAFAFLIALFASRKVALKRE